MSRHRRRAPDTAPRADAAQMLGQILPVLTNLITGSGSASDPDTAWVAQYGGELAPETLARLANAEPFQRVCSEFPLWLWSAGVRVYVEDADPQALLTAWEGLGAPQAFARAQFLANVLGGAAVVMETGQSFAAPLDSERLDRVRLVVMNGYALRPEALIDDPASPYYGRPEWYVQTSRQGRIHASHVLPFLGRERAIPELSQGAWSSWPAVSVIQACWGALTQWVSTNSSTTAAARRMSTFFMEHPEFFAKMAADPAGFQAVLETLTQKMGVSNTVHSPPGAKLSAASLSLSGLGEVHAQAAARLSMESYIPLTQLGIPVPAGLGSGNAVEQAAFETHLRGTFGSSDWAGYAAGYQRLFDVTKRAVYGATPPRWQGCEPGDFRAPTDLERAQLFQAEANAAKTLIDAGALSPASVRVADGRVEIVEVAPRVDASPSSTLIALEQDFADLAGLIAEVRRIVPDLDPETWPHLTLLYLGDVPEREALRVRATALDIADELPDTLIPIEVGPLGDDGAIVLHVRRRGLDAVQGRLLRAAAPMVRAAQFPRFVPHITIGYARDLTDAQIEALAAIAVPAEIEAGPVVLRRGDRELVRADEESFEPPKGVQENARRALEVRASKPPSERGMTDVGVARARDLANGRAVSMTTIKRMKAYFDRHEVDKKGATWDEQGKGWQAWMGWGGDEGWTWARSIVERTPTAPIAS